MAGYDDSGYSEAKGMLGAKTAQELTEKRLEKECKELLRDIDRRLPGGGRYILICILRLKLEQLRWLRDGGLIICEARGGDERCSTKRQMCILDLRL